MEQAMTVPGTSPPRGAAPEPAEQSVVVRRAVARVETARRRVTDPDNAARPGGSRAHPDRRGRRDPHPEPRGNLTDPDSSIMPTSNGWVQGYNTQFAVTTDQIIVGLQVSTNPADIASYIPMVDTVTTTAAALGATTELGTLLLDTGYCSNATLTAPGPDRLIATGKTRSIRQAARDHPAAGPPPGDASPREAMEHRLRTPPRRTALHPPRRHRRTRHRELQETARPVLPPRPRSSHQRSPPRRHRLQPPQDLPRRSRLNTTADRPIPTTPGTHPNRQQAPGEAHVTETPITAGSG